MSLNGLDSPEVQEAHQTAVIEVGGWFLLKYSSRDSVQLLGRGKGGVHETRLAIADYGEASPLYGLIMYRRRKVVVKYVPEGTSRVLLARTAVHFQDVLEKYSPYETLLEIKSPEGLNDTSLAASFPLHTASPSASSGRLNEISEDAEDSSASARPTASSTAPTSSYLGPPRHRGERRLGRGLRSEPSPPRAKQMDSESQSNLPSPLSPAPSSSASAKTMHISQYLVRDDSGQHSITSLNSASTVPTSQFTALDRYSKSTESTMSTAESERLSTPTSPPFVASQGGPLDEMAEPAATTPPLVLEEPTGRASELAEVETRGMLSPRPSTQQSVNTASLPDPPSSSGLSKYDDDPYDFSKFDIKPKVKLGPRPVVPGERTKRPTVASVASVPATYRPTSSRKQESSERVLSRPKSQGPITATVHSPNATKLPLPPPIPDMPEYTPRPLSRGSVKSLPSHKSTAMTPDKIRLMKALELRKKQLRKSNPQPQNFVPPSEETPAVPPVPESLPQQGVKKGPGTTLQPDVSDPDDPQAPWKGADSGISMNYDRERGHDEKNGQQWQSEESQRTRTEHSRSSGEVTASAAVSEPPKVDTPRAAAFEAEPKVRLGELEHRTLYEETDDEEQPVVRSSKGRIQEGLDETLPAQEEESNSRTDADPVPVPTITMADGSRPLSSTQQNHNSENVDPTASDTERGDYESISSGDDLAVPERGVRRKGSDIMKRRRGFVEPLHVDPDAEYSSGDEFMQELQTATLQEAKPITVSKSPIAAYFPRRPSYNSMASEVSVRSININRTSTMPPDFSEMQDRLIPEPNSASQSRPWTASTPPFESNDPMAAMRRNVSAGISHRIQALGRSSREISPASSPSTTSLTPEISPVEATSLDRNERRRTSPSTAFRTNSFKAMSRASARMSSMHNQSSVNNHASTGSSAVWNVQHDSSANRNSVSVSARIVRPSPVEQPDSTATSVDQEEQLQRSELKISHDTPAQPKVPQLHRIDTNPKVEATQPDVSPLTTRSPADGTRQLHSASRFGRHKPSISISSPSVDDFPSPPRTNSVSANDEAATSRDKDTRTSRFFKRMSNIGNKRRSGVPQSIASSNSTASERGSFIAASMPSSKDRQDTPPAVVVGDLNIQFPDSLLWKRRIVQIDDNGNLLFSVSQAMEHQRGSVKRYPLQEFKMPYIPDLEIQELPNSIMLDFVDGTTLQLACEDAMTHRQVVHVLKSYWRAWSVL
ncbi:hypothetical protein LTR37_019496 [Vermiconidia calcicola]|uniref:Uncharacterized protein n=1 Tax=Vermiconidia calcicola TaxID=1690605 RepID=A0ACC3ME39_9PEZI|nr:hypothetical protein LTR37_019496 [Vermiconidia calcicola]